MITDCNINTEYIALASYDFRIKDKMTVFWADVKQKYQAYNNAGKVKMQEFGTVKSTGEKAYLFTVENKNGMSVDFTTLGATITAIRVPDKNGKIIDVAQGYTNAESYTDYPVGHAGGTIGPVANKIDYGTFELNGIKYELEKNKDNGRTHCHGASTGLDIKNWKYELIENGIRFYITKEDGEGGHPANVDISVSYKLTDKNELKIIYEAKSDKDTILNLTNHSYFNLDGEENAEEGAVLNHIVELPNSSKITVNNEVAVPTGELREVFGTPFDFKMPHVIKDRINEDNDQLKIGAGFDQNYCIDGYDGKTMIDVAKVKSENTGIVLTVSTNLPGFQFYTANHLGKPVQPMGKSGKRYEKRSSLCVEPQFYPNAINIDGFEKPILKKGEKLKKEIDYKFSTEK